MVNQLPLHAAAHPTLDELWSDLAARTPPRLAIVLAASGLGAAAWSRWADLPWILTLPAVIVAAFACDALLRGTARDEQPLQARSLRAASVIARAVAALSAATIGLLLLGILFGDSIEVMRR